MRIEYHPRAKIELLSAARFYDKKSPSLGHDLLEEIEFAVTEIRDTPMRWPIFRGDARCYLLKRFPYEIYYRVFADRIRIIIIKHHSQHPNYGMRRK